VHSAEFEALLGAPVRARSAHFCVHHLSTLRFAAVATPPAARRKKLSTGCETPGAATVDDFRSGAPAHRFGAVVPKRHAKRAVTRSLLKRLVREAVARRLDHLPDGAWLVRLKASFETAQYPSAASRALHDAAARELDELIARAAAPRRTPG
jgi:ribonuclease P protein component